MSNNNMTIIEAMDIYFKDDKNNPEFVLDESTFKKRYRTLCRKYHPDNNSQGAEKFREVKTAYILITDYLNTLYNNDYNLLWDSYKNNKTIINNYSNPSPNPNNDNNTFTVGDSVSGMVPDILSSIFILKGVVLKEFPEFDFPNDEYLEDYLNMFRYPSKYDLNTASKRIKEYMEILIDNFNKYYKMPIYFHDLTNYDVYNFYDDLKKIWSNLVIYKDNKYKNMTKEDIRKICRIILKRIDEVFEASKSNFNIFKRRSMLVNLGKLIRLVDREDFAYNEVITRIYYFLYELKLYQQSEEVYRNNNAVFANYSSSDTYEIAKLVDEWRDYLEKNEISTKTV